MKIYFSLFYFLLFLSLQAKAQCSAENTAFKSGETLFYDMYFNWKFVWVKVGTASMNISNTVYEGKPAYRTRLITRSSERADRFFVLRDTLTSYVGHDLTPFYYKKGANEGGAYRAENVWYNYSNGRAYARQRYQNKEGKVSWRNYDDHLCIFDMLSMLLRARSFDASQYKTGHKIRFRMAEGDKCETQTLVFRGKKTFKMDNSTTKYRCLVFSFVEYDDNKEKEVVTFYVTDDENHLPVRLDLYLKFGSAKAFLVGAKGIRNPQAALIK